MGEEREAHWKKKYFDSLEELEARERQWTQQEQILRQLASRLTLAADGSDAELSHTLDRLRDDLRRKAPAARLAGHLETINAAILRLDEKRREQARRITPSTALSKVLDRIELPQGLRRKGRELNKRLARADADSDPQPLIDAFAELMQQSLDWLAEAAEEANADHETTPSSTGLFRRLFQAGNDGDKDEAAGDLRPVGQALAQALSRLEVAEPHRDRRDALVASARRIHDDEALRAWTRQLEDWLAELAIPAVEPPNEVLLELLERLDLPAGLEAEVERLKQRLAGDLTPASLSRSVADLADLIARARQAVQQEKDEIERFLADLTNRLGEIDASLADSMQAHQQMVSARHDFDRRMTGEVRGMEESVREADELEALKAAIRARIEHIQHHMQDWREKESAREARLREENEQLAAQLEAFRSEAMGLHDKLEEARREAMRDALTGLPNRMAWEERMQAELARAERHGRPLTLGILDVDHFKRINDRFGHPAGDRVLRILADLFRQQTRASDFLARFGGEEFMLVLPETSGPDALVVADKLRESVAQAHFHYRKQSVPVTLSCGLAQYRPGETLEQLYARADAALYRAKEGGRNRCELAPTT